MTSAAWLVLLGASGGNTEIHPYPFVPLCLDTTPKLDLSIEAFSPSDVDPALDP